MISFADKASSVNLVENSGIVTHQLHQQGQIVLQHFDHQFQGMLNGWEARLARKIIIGHFLVKQMWRMVSTDGVNQALAQCLNQGFFVAVRIDGRISLDGETLLVIVAVIEPEVMWASLWGYLFVFQRNVVLE